MPASEFKKLIVDEGGSEILTSIFEDNVRDWQGWKTVNSGIRETLQSDRRSKFVLMNNGVTIITRNLTRVGDKFTISDQIVNGCQSSNVLFEQREIGDDVMVPLRLIHTLDDTIKELITTATNSQTDIKPEQFSSRRNFARGLEQFFATFPEEQRLYYERRDGQHDRGSEPKVRVIDIATVLEAMPRYLWKRPTRLPRITGTSAIRLERRYSSRATHTGPTTTRRMRGSSSKAIIEARPSTRPTNPPVGTF